MVRLRMIYAWVFHMITELNGYGVSMNLIDIYTPLQFDGDSGPSSIKPSDNGDTQISGSMELGTCLEVSSETISYHITIYIYTRIS